MLISAAIEHEIWIIAALAVLLTQTAIIATSVYLHRALAHRAIHVHRAAEIVFRVVLWLTTGQRRREWGAVHRKHHAYTDQHGDPHRPRLVGLGRVQFSNVPYYLREARNAETLRRFAPDLLEDPLDRLLFLWRWAGLGLGVAGLMVLLGPTTGGAAAVGHAVLYVFVAAPLVTGVGDWYGGQDFDNTAYTSRLLACVTGGESLHNNDHACPRAPKFSVMRSEFDPSWLLIRALAALGLVTIDGSSAPAHAGAAKRG
jgi:stearoyl-CoA desaturase (delta-9 desaturase)